MKWKIDYSKSAYKFMKKHYIESSVSLELKKVLIKFAVSRNVVEIKQDLSLSLSS